MGFIPTPDVVEGPIKSGAEAAGQTIINSTAGVLTEAVEKTAKDQLDFVSTMQTIVGIMNNGFFKKVL